MNKLFSLLLTCCIVLVTQSAFADKTAVDAIVIMDSSGSMKKTDPKSLRKPAAKLFLSLLNQSDRASVMSFSDNGYPITYLNTLDTEKNIQLTLNATDKVSTKGVYTNIHAAIERAYKIISSDKSERRPIIILLSDGKMDVGNDDKSLALSRQLLEETSPKLIDAGIKVYSIAFTENSDRALLTEMSEKTGGFCKVADNDKELHLAFTSIFEQSKAPDMLPLTENTFLADESIKEITIVASKENADSKIFIEDPEQQRFDASVNNKNIKWFISDTFDMITLRKPKPGEWKILFSDNNNKAYIVADMSMKSQFDFINENNIEKMQALAWLEKEDNIVNEAKIIDSLEGSIELVSPGDQTIKLPLGQVLNNEEQLGKFIGNHTPKEKGMYFATITLKSQTFERQKTFSFNAKGIPEMPEEPVPAPVTEPVAEETPELSTEKPAEAEKKPEPEVSAEETEEEGDLLKSILIFVVINILIVIIGLTVFLILKLKKSKQTNAEEES